MKPLIPSRLRLSALLVALICLIASVVLGIAVAGARRAGAIDATIIHAVHRIAGQHSTLADVLITLSDTVVIFGGILALMIVGLVRRRWEVAVLAVAAPAIAIGLTELVGKPLTDRRIHGWLSYPSGHTVAAVSTLTVALLLIVAGGSVLRAVLATLGWAALSLVIMVGMVAKNDHYPSDTIGGFCLALAVVLPCVVLADRWRFRNQATIPQPRVGGVDPAMLAPMPEPVAESALEPATDRFPAQPLPEVSDAG
jgi:undecaprenyl-diphosphatase